MPSYGRGGRVHFRFAWEDGASKMECTGWLVEIQVIVLYDLNIFVFLSKYKSTHLCTLFFVHLIGENEKVNKNVRMLQFIDECDEY